MFNRRTFLAMFSQAGLMFVLPFWGGCVSKRAAWDSRIGSYTYDEAVIEMGPPDREATLEDGRIVCDWRTAKGSSVGMGFGGSIGWDYYGTPIPQTYTVSESPDFYLRLMFSAEKKLLEWKKVRR